MKVLHPSNVLGVVAAVAVVGALSLVPRVFAEETPVRRGVVAVGVVDGGLMVRSTLCSGDPVTVTVSHGSPNGPGVRAVLATEAVRQARVELPATLDGNTTLTLTAPELDGLVVTAARWRALDEGVWLVASAPEAPETTTIKASELREWSC